MGCRLDFCDFLDPGINLKINFRSITVENWKPTLSSHSTCRTVLHSLDRVENIIKRRKYFWRTEQIRLRNDQLPYDKKITPSWSSDDTAKPPPNALIGFPLQGAHGHTRASMALNLPRVDIVVVSWLCSPKHYRPRCNHKRTVFSRNLFAIKERKSAIMVDIFLKLPTNLQVETIWKLFQPPPTPRQILLWRCNLKGTHHLVLARLVIPVYGGFQPSNYSSKYAPWMPGA